VRSNSPRNTSRIGHTKVATTPVARASLGKRVPLPLVPFPSGSHDLAYSWGQWSGSMAISFLRPARKFLIEVVLPRILMPPPETRPTMSVPADQPKTQDRPYVVEYYYKARWGFADEFIRLFKKNHLPVLKKQIETGRFLHVTAVKPRYHATEDGRWDYRVTIVFKDVAAAHVVSDEEAIKKDLFPDQESFKQEEQRRFEILLAHWDVPIVEVDLDR
jgi:hypothetical protein